jgi:hypothetical protein
MFNDVTLDNLIVAHYDVERHKSKESFEVREEIFKYIESKRMIMKPWVIQHMGVNLDQVGLMTLVNMKHLQGDTWNADHIARGVLDATDIRFSHRGVTLKTILDILDNKIGINNNKTFISGIWCNKTLFYYYTREKSSVLTLENIKHILENFVSQSDDIRKFKYILTKFPTFSLDEEALKKLSITALANGKQNLSAYLFARTTAV